MVCKYCGNDMLDGSGAEYHDYFCPVCRARFGTIRADGRIGPYLAWIAPKSIPKRNKIVRDRVLNRTLARRGIHAR
jgi:hypothetical protein